MISEKEIINFVKNSILGLESVMDSINDNNLGIVKEKISSMKKQSSDMYENILLSGGIFEEDVTVEDGDKRSWKMAWCKEQGLAPLTAIAQYKSEVAYIKWKNSKRNINDIGDKRSWKIAWCKEQGLAPSTFYVWSMAEEAYKEQFENKRK